MTSANFQLSSNNGTSYLAAGVPLAGSNALTLGAYNCKAKLTDPAGVASVDWSWASADDTTLAGSMPTLTPNFSDKTVSFSVPSAAATYLLKAVVNGGFNGQGKADPTYTKILAIKVKTSGGRQLLGVGETYEGDASYGWTPVINDLIKNAGTGGGGSSGTIVATGQTSVLTPSTVTITGTNIEVGPTLSIACNNGDIVEVWVKCFGQPGGSTNGNELRIGYKTGGGAFTALNETMVKREYTGYQNYLVTFGRFTASSTATWDIRMLMTADGSGVGNPQSHGPYHIMAHVIRP